MTTDAKRVPVIWPDMTITLTQEEYEAFAAAIVVFNMVDPPPGQEENYVHISKQHMVLLDKLSAAREQARAARAEQSGEGKCIRQEDC